MAFVGQFQMKKRERESARAWKKKKNSTKNSIYVKKARVHKSIRPKKKRANIDIGFSHPPRARINALIKYKYAKTIRQNLKILPFFSSQVLARVCAVTQTHTVKKETRVGTKAAGRFVGCDRVTCSCYAIFIVPIARSLACWIYKNIRKKKEEEKEVGSKKNERAWKYRPRTLIAQQNTVF